MKKISTLIYQKTDKKSSKIRRRKVRLAVEAGAANINNFFEREVN